MTPSEKTLAQILQIEGNQENYFVPKYQRPYIWRRENWDDLLRDLEEDHEHFMGSIICVPRIADDVSPGERFQYEIIDGQQRLTTISILLCAIYKKLLECRPETAAVEEQLDKWKSVRSSVLRKLVSEKNGKLGEFDEPLEKKGKTAFFARVLPSVQGQNREDYRAVLLDSGALSEQSYPAHWGNRRIAKAYYHFLRHTPETFEGLSDLIQIINSLRFIHISVPSHADAYRLFEALNNRGAPLSALDIIKNGILARVEREKKSVDDAFEMWKDMTDRLTEDDAIQERYLRHFYHAFRHRKELGVSKYPRATKSTMIRIYAEITNRNAYHLLAELAEKAKFYERLIAPDGVGQSSQRAALLNDLLRIGAAPAHQLLLYLLDAEKRGLLEQSSTFNQIAGFLAKYFVRRNVTDQPGTNRLDPIFASIFDAAQVEIKKNGGLSVAWLSDKMKNSKTDRPASDEDFKAALSDNLWYYDPRMARYILCRLNESFTTKEYDPNVWKQDERGAFIWTVEHVLPQGERLRKEWVDMIAAGNVEKARAIQEDWVHCLGNLTLSAYNSKLSDRPFEKKKEKADVSVEGDKLNIGYKNRLPLNELPFKIAGKDVSLASAKKWTVAEIEARNNTIVARCMKLFAL